jgi:hypothetical protein
MRKCRSLIPLSEALAHINDPTVAAQAPLQAAYLKFVRDVRPRIGQLRTVCGNGPRTGVLH